MAIEVNDANLGAVRLKFDDADDLNFSLALGAGTFGNSVTRTSVAVLTKQPSNVLMKAKLTSGALTVKLDVHSGTPNFAGAPEVTLDDTEGKCVEIQTTEANPYVSVQCVSGVAGCVVDTSAMLITGLVPAGGGYHELGRAFNAELGVYDDDVVA